MRLVLNVHKVPTASKEDEYRPNPPCPDPIRRLCLWKGSCLVFTSSLALSLGPCVPVSTAAAAAAAAAATATATNTNVEAKMMQQCQSGALMQEQAITGAYEQECMKLAVREIPYQHGDGDKGTLRIQQGVAGAGTTGLAVWNSSLLLARLLQQIASFRNTSIPWSSLRILELGCGTGLASMMAAATGATQVIATDGNASVVQLAQQNIRDNNLSDRVQAQVLLWGFMNALDFADDMDLVMGSDLTYQSQNWPALAETLATIVKPRTGVIVYLSLGHAGFAVQAELQGFLSVAQQYGLTAVTDPSPLGYPTADLTRLVYEKCIQPEELSIVQSTGGVRVLLLQRKR